MLTPAKLLGRFVGIALTMLATSAVSADDAQPTPIDATEAVSPSADVKPAAPIAPQPVSPGSAGWSAAYAPSGSYWYHTPGYAAGMHPTSWNGYWNYSTAWGAPGYTAYWHGWYAGPYWHGTYGGGPEMDYVWPTWSRHGWGYSATGWGHGYWHRHRILAPSYH